MAEKTLIQTDDVATQPRPVRNVKSYIRTLDGSEHPALNAINAGVVYDIQNSVYVLEAPLESLNEEVEREAKLFTEALKSYESDVPEKHKTGVDIGQPCSIKEVVELIDLSLNEYRKDGHRTVWQVVRKGFWKLSEGSEGLENWLELLPSSNDYCSLIYGGISLILKAAGRIGDVRNEAFTALAEIPAYLENTKQAVGIFSKSENLQKCGVKLYTVTLAALRHILKWFKKRAIGRAFGAFIKQSSYQTQLTGKIKEIETVSSRFKEISIICMQREVVNTSRTVNSLAAVSINNDAVLKEAIDQTNVKLTLKAEKTDETLEDLILSETKQHETTQQVLSDELQALKRQYGDQLELNKKTAESLNSLQTLLESIYTTLPLYQIPKEEGSPPPYINVVKSSAILEILKYEKDFSEKDLFQCLRAVGQMSRPEQDRAVWTMKSQKLRDWMLDTSSSALLINGNCSSTTARSPITFVCARLIDMLQTSKRIMVIHFFCGEHIAAATDENANPTAMMNSLLAQLLMQYPDFEISGQDLAEVSRDTLDNVARLFKKLIGQLPPSTMLFCVVDGVSLYEDSIRLEETEQVMRELTGLTEERDGPVFKLMLTSATRVKHPPETLKQDNILAVPRNVPPQSQFSPSKWESQVGSYFNESESGAV